MSPKFLLDTNAISEPLKPRPNLEFMRRLQSNRDHLAISVITWHEALFGLRRMAVGKRREQVQAYLADVIARTVPILSYDTAAAEWHATERARLDARGRPASFADGQVAAIAKVHNLTLVTANEKDFRWFDGLRVESWMG